MPQVTAEDEHEAQQRPMPGPTDDQTEADKNPTVEQPGKAAPVADQTSGTSYLRNVHFPLARKLPFSAKCALPLSRISSEVQCALSLISKGGSFSGMRVAARYLLAHLRKQFCGLATMPERFPNSNQGG